MEWELGRHDFSKLHLSDGTSARGVPDAIRELALAQDLQAARSGYRRLDNWIVVQGALYDAASAAAPCLVAALMTCGNSGRAYILDLLVQIGTGQSRAESSSPDEDDLACRCLDEVARGMPIYCHIVETSGDPDVQAACVDLLGLCARSSRMMRERAAWYMRRVLAGRCTTGVRALATNWLAELDP
jgi:hypothetical protein